MDKPHKKLDVWKASMELVKEIYEITTIFPEEEKFGLLAQMRRTAISIPCNIAEGAGRQGKAQFRNFLSIAQGSVSDLDTQLEIAVILGYLKPQRLEPISDLLLRIDKMLTSLIRKLLLKD